MYVGFFLKEVYNLYISERPPFFSQKRKFEMVVDTEVYLLYDAF